MNWFSSSSREGGSSRPTTPWRPSRRASSPSSLKGTFGYVYSTVYTAVSRLETSFDPNINIKRVQKHKWSYKDLEYVFHFVLWIFWVSIMKSPPFPLKLGIPILYTIAIILPITSQFFFPALPILTWVLTFFSSRFIPVAWRPPISVSLLPTLESVLYGANISDILTRFTHPILDIPAWLSYGVIHFIGPFIVAAFLWLFAAKGSLKYWCNAFGYLNIVGVICQIIFPCAAPWYELRNGLTPANYSMHGSPGGLARIDAIFHSNGYATTFSNAPVVFGAFPSLHAGCATMEALFISHFWPHLKPYAWGYCGILYWATMYLTHHYLIDVVGGACLAVAVFYFFMPPRLRFPNNGTNTNKHPRSKLEQYDLEGGGATSGYRPSSPGGSLSSRSSTESSIPNPLAPYRSPNPDSSKFPSSPRSAAPLLQLQKDRRQHRHTASIASLIRADERVEDGWSPVGSRSFVFPPQGPIGGGREREVEGAAGQEIGELLPSVNAKLTAPGGDIPRARSPGIPNRQEE